MRLADQAARARLRQRLEAFILAATGTYGELRLADLLRGRR